MPFLASPDYIRDQIPIPNTASQLFFSPQSSYSTDSTVPCSVATVRGAGFPQVQIACDEGLAGVGLVLHQVILIHYLDDVYASKFDLWRNQVENDGELSSIFVEGFVPGWKP